VILFSCWLPPAAWIGVHAYGAQTKYLGAITADPFLLPTLCMSVLMGTAGIILRFWRAFHQQWDWPLALASALTGSVALEAITNC
jgi:hypothetical protein